MKGIDEEGGLWLSNNILQTAENEKLMIQQILFNLDAEKGGGVPTLLS